MILLSSLFWTITVVALHTSKLNTYTSKTLLLPVIVWLFATVCDQELVATWCSGTPLRNLPVMITDEIIINCQLDTAIQTTVPSCALNTLGLSFIKKLNWTFHISPLAKSASMKLSVLFRLLQFFSFFIPPFLEYSSIQRTLSTYVWNTTFVTMSLNTTLLNMIS